MAVEASDIRQLFNNAAAYSAMSIDKHSSKALCVQPTNRPGDRIRCILSRPTSHDSFTTQ